VLSKHAEFYAELKYVKNVAKKFTQKSCEQKNEGKIVFFPTFITDHQRYWLRTFLGNFFGTSSIGLNSAFLDLN
jgi:hypothetical protein